MFLSTPQCTNTIANRLFLMTVKGSTICEAGQVALVGHFANPGCLGRFPLLNAVRRRAPGQAVAAGG